MQAIQVIPLNKLLTRKKFRFHKKFELNMNQDASDSSDSSDSVKQVVNPKKKYIFQFDIAG